MMNPLARVWNAIKSRTRSYQTRFSYFGRNNAGVPVSHDIAMQVSAVWACIDVIASALSSTDWNVYGGTRGADKKTLLPDDSLQYILNSRWNREMTAQSGKRATLIAAVGFGNGVAEIEKDAAGRIIGLWPLDPSRVEVRRDQDTLELFYRCFQVRSGSFVDLNPADVFHIRGAGLTGFAGDDPIGRAIQSIANAVAIDQFGASYFANGTQLGVVLEHPGLNKMDDATYNRLKESWEERHVGYDPETGHRKSFRIGFLSGGMKLHQLNIDAEKAQMVEAKQLSVEEICRWFRVPPHKIAHLLRATNNNIEHQGLEFSRDTIRPWKTEIEQECDWSLINSRGPKKFIELDVDWMEQGDYKSRMEAYSTARGMGVFSVNDVLRKLGENTIGPEGDKRTMNGASVLLEDVGKNMLPKALPAPMKPDEPDEDDSDLRDWARSLYADMSDRYAERMAKNATRANPMPELARKDAAEFLASKWIRIAPSLKAKRPDINYAAAMALGVAVIDGMSPDDAVVELFTKELA